MSPRALIGWPAAGDNEEAEAETHACEWCRERDYTEQMVRRWCDVVCEKVLVCRFCDDDPPPMADDEAERARERARGIWPT